MTKATITKGHSPGRPHQVEGIDWRPRGGPIRVIVWATGVK